MSLDPKWNRSEFDKIGLIDWKYFFQKPCQLWWGWGWDWVLKKLIQVSLYEEEKMTVSKWYAGARSGPRPLLIRIRGVSPQWCGDTSLSVVETKEM
jgi:hypothetical protein